MSENVTYTILDNGIHKFVWNDNIRDAVYEHAAYYREMNHDLAANERVLILIDLSQSGAPPFKILNDAFQKSGMRKDIDYRTAYLADDSFVEVMMKNFTMVNRISGNRAFFKPGEEEEATQWLLSQ